MNVLITGGAGYIGSHTAKILAAAGLHPVVVDDLRTGHRHAVRWGPLVEADIINREALRAVFNEYPIDTVIHFAASAYVGESVRSPSLYFQNNVCGTLSLLEVMREYGVNKIVFSSSCATYGIPRNGLISEEDPQQPVNPYGESKLMVEKILRWYGDAYGLFSVWLRYFNAAGADQAGELGEEHDPETHLIPLAIAAAAGDGRFLEIYGTDYDTPDGTAVRDYVHVMDLAWAHLSAVRYLVAGGASDAFNLGTSSGHSVRQVISMVEKVSGQTVPVAECNRRHGDPPSLIAQAAKAKTVLGFHPQWSTLEAIVRTAWDWNMASRRRRAADVAVSD